MCSTPLTTPEGREAACRRCDECLAARRNEWVSRAMAEKATSGEALVLCLTYGNDTPERRDGAAMFRYADVRRFLAGVRRKVFYHTGETGAVRFLAAGEQGSRDGRCHWHIVLFADVDLIALGEWKAPWGVVTGRENIVSPNGRDDKYRRSWSLWPHGFVTVQEPDEGGMAYALVYALKDQFAADRAKGTKRETKGESYATGVFRMSKLPPIGWPFLERLLADLAAKESVLPRVQLTVPERSGVWIPRGLLRKRLLAGLREINDLVRETRGRDCRQWSSLLASCAESETDMEVLDGDLGAEKAQADEAAERVEFDGRWRSDEAERRRIVRRCGSTLPCNACLDGLWAEGRCEAEGVEALVDDETGGFAGYAVAGGGPREERQAQLRQRQADGRGGRLHPLCKRRGSREVVAVFKKTGI